MVPDREPSSSAEKGGAHAWLRARPWVWVVLLFVAVVLANVVMLVIALTHQPIRVN